MSLLSISAFACVCLQVGGVHVFPVPQLFGRHNSSMTIPADSGKQTAQELEAGSYSPRQAASRYHNRSFIHSCLQRLLRASDRAKLIWRKGVVISRKRPVAMKQKKRKAILWWVLLSVWKKEREDNTWPYRMSNISGFRTHKNPSMLRQARTTHLSRRCLASCPCAHMTFPSPLHRQALKAELASAIQSSPAVVHQTIGLRFHLSS